MRFPTITSVLLSGLFVACAGSSESASSASAGIRELDASEALSDLEELGATIRASYAPLEFKGQRFGFDLDQALAVARTEVTAGTNEADRTRPLYELLAKLHDAHVSLRPHATSDAAVTSALPFDMSPIEDKLVVTRSSTPEITPGDLVLAIDGLDPATMEASLASIVQLATPDNTLRKMVTLMTQRPFYVPKAILPNGDRAQVLVEHVDGTRATLTLPWSRSSTVTERIKAVLDAAAAAAKEPLNLSPNAVADEVAADMVAPPAAPAISLGTPAAFFLGSPVVSTFGFAQVAPSKPMPQPAELGAVTYSSSGKKILLLRVASFIARDVNASLDWVAALLAEQTGRVDVVVVDVTGNGGGFGSYCSGLASLFLAAPIPANFLALGADRSWLDTYTSFLSDPAATPRAKQTYGEIVQDLETAMDAKQRLTPFVRDTEIDLGTGVDPDDTLYGPTLSPNPRPHWTGPVLLLTNAGSASAADLFPLMLQNGKVAKVFGSQSAGAGGSVTWTASLTNSGAELDLTRSVLAVHDPVTGEPKLVENQGVLPDYPHVVTLADMRAGYVDYVKHFSEVAATLTR